MAVAGIVAGIMGVVSHVPLVPVARCPLRQSDASEHKLYIWMDGWMVCMRESLFIYNIYIYIYKYKYIYININIYKYEYIYREREKERECVCVFYQVFHYQSVKYITCHGTVALYRVYRRRNINSRYI